MLKIIFSLVLICIILQGDFANSAVEQPDKINDDENRFDPVAFILSRFFGFSSDDNPKKTADIDGIPSSRRPLPASSADILPSEQAAEDESGQSRPCSHHNNLRSEFKYPEEHACANDLRSLCSSIKSPSTVSETYHARMCLWNHNERLSSSCMAYLTVESPSVVEPCYHQIKTFCSRVEPGESRIQNCLYENLDDLTVRCANALQDDHVPKEIDSDDFGLVSETNGDSVGFMSIISMLDAFDRMISSPNPLYHLSSSSSSSNSDAIPSSISVTKRTTTRDGKVESETTTTTITRSGGEKESFIQTSSLISSPGVILEELEDVEALEEPAALAAAPKSLRAPAGIFQIFPELSFLIFSPANEESEDFAQEEANEVEERQEHFRRQDNAEVQTHGEGQGEVLASEDQRDVVEEELPLPPANKRNPTEILGTALSSLKSSLSAGAKGFVSGALNLSAKAIASALQLVDDSPPTTA